ncbi:uncharacterized protein [Ptychodera flava]|uniref:uncharacterized protein n=1 Tax=Ptychodera flava TaxID=63121 RepID=UPI003969E58C
MAMNHRRAAIIFDQLQRRSIWNFKLRYKIFLVVLVVFISTVYGDECSCEVGKFCDSIHGLCQLCTLCESLPDDNCAMCPHIDGDTNADGANTNDQGQGGEINNWSNMGVDATVAGCLWRCYCLGHSLRTEKTVKKERKQNKWHDYRARNWSTSAGQTII